MSFFGRMNRSLPHDTFLYLGGNEQSTHKYVSELLGKETIDTNSYGKSSGRNGNYSTNFQNAGRELMTPDEVRLLDNRYALLFIRGERPVKDLKYNIWKHPNVALTEKGGAANYDHGSTDHAIGSITVMKNDPSIPDPVIPEALREALQHYEVLSEEELQEIFETQKKEKKQHEEKSKH